MKNFHKSHQQWHKKSPITKKMGLFHEQIICLELPKMKNKHYFFFNPDSQPDRKKTIFLRLPFEGNT